MIYYFAYGMNTNLNQMARRCPAAKCLGPATLPGYRFRFAGHADVVQDRTSSVKGVLWMVTEDCLAALDQLEGYPVYYNSEELQVEYDDEILFAEVYYMNPGMPSSDPSQGYLDMVVEGYHQNGVPIDQIRKCLKHIDIQSELSYN